MTAVTLNFEDPIVFEARTHGLKPELLYRTHCVNAFLKVARQHN